jgi:hypothetical protein
MRQWVPYVLRLGEEMPLLLSLLAKAQHLWWTFCVDRTVKIQLHPAPEQAQALRETLEQFTSAFNSVHSSGKPQEYKSVLSNRQEQETRYETTLARLELCPTVWVSCLQGPGTGNTGSQSRPPSYLANL